MNNQSQLKIDSDEQDKKTQSTKDTISIPSNDLQKVDLGGVQTPFSPARFLIITIGGIFLAEVIAMIFIYGFPFLPYYQQVLLDASIMVVLIFPVVYYFSLRPLLLYIKKHQRLENALRQSEERFALAYRSNPAALSITRVEDGCFIEVNDSFLRQSGYFRDEVIGHTPDELNLYPNPNELEKLEWLLLKDRNVDGFEMTVRVKSGEIRNISVSAEAIELGSEVNILAVASDITERKQAEARLQRVNHALFVLKECNKILVRAKNETELLQQMCEVIVDVGEYRMAWVGFAEQDQARSVRPIAQVGFEDGYLGLAQITWADNERGRGLTGTAIREGLTQINQNFQDNPKMEPWRAAALSRGYQSSIALPLKDESSTFGALMIYSASPDGFDDDEVSLLNELAGDMAFGVTTLRVRAERNQAYEELELRVQERTAELKMANSELKQEITERKRAEEGLRAAYGELTRFNRAMVDRELRMIELKKEINVLCEGAGQPTRYPLDFEKEEQWTSQKHA
jgi:PAS domain S-box-containing protein